MSLTGRKWILPEQDPNLFKQDHNLEAWVRWILAQRGLVEEEQVRAYLSPSLAELPDPGLLADMPKAIERILIAIREQQPIVVFGDYDVDGVCATALMVEFLRQVGGRVSYYLPNRQDEGYGLNTTAVQTLAKQAKLLITVDCGITAHAEIALARELGLDVVVVDHHRVDGTLPPAIANLNPHRSDCAYPGKNLCGAGVAFLLVAALRRALREQGEFNHQSEPDLREALDMVGLATVADMVPLQGVNRILVAVGLKQLAKTHRLGLCALMDVAGVKPERLTATDLAFRLAPRINARGRLYHANEAVELMLTKDAEQAKQLAASMDVANRQRRDIEQAITKEAIARIENLDNELVPAIVLFDPTWHPGVLGLVASRLVHRFHRPTVIIGEGGKGSGRTFENFDLFAAVQSSAEHLLRFGGHAAAAGVTLVPENIEPFRQALCREVELQLGRPPFVASLRPDMEIQVQHLSLDLLNHLNQLAPFGQANPEPLLMTRKLRVKSKYIVGDRHLKIHFHDVPHTAIAFGMGELMDQVPPQVDAAFRLTRNVFREKESLELVIEDLRP